MVDISAIAGAVGSLNAASQMAQALIGIRDAQTFSDKAIELQRKVLEAQGHASAAYAAQTDLTNRIRELESEIVQLKDWRAEHERYELKELHAGSLAYAVKAGMERGEPPHYICAACVQKGQKSILQGRTTSLGILELACPACGLVITRGLDPSWKP